MQLKRTGLPSCCAPLLGVTLIPVSLNGITCGPENGVLFSGSCHELVPLPNWNVYVCGPGASVLVASHSCILPTVFLTDMGIVVVPSMTRLWTVGVTEFWYMTS